MAQWGKLITTVVMACPLACCFGICTLSHLSSCCDLLASDESLLIHFRLEVASKLKWLCCTHSPPLVIESPVAKTSWEFSLTTSNNHLSSPWHHAL